MNLETPLFILPLITGPLLIIAGFILLKKPPKEINYFYGYRTNLAMKSQAHWEFAQTYSAKRMIRWGAYYTLTLFLGMIHGIHITIELFLTFILLLLFVLMPVVETQKALKKKFELQK